MTADVPPRPNNFEGLRLLAAIQVLLYHGWERLELAGRHRVLDGAMHALAHVPGVPVFFVLSGFLIPWAWSRQPIYAQFARNRFFRMYPALWMAFAVTVFILAIHGFIRPDNLTHRSMIAWFAAQLSFAQFFTAPELRGYGLGNPNGSLWTIVVELQFYLVVPLLFALGRKARGRMNLVIAGLCILSLLANAFIHRLDQTRTTTKLLGVTVFPFLFYFLIGTLAWWNWSRIRALVVGRAVMWSSVFALYSAVIGGMFKLYSVSYWPTSILQLVSIVLLAAAVLAVAFTNTSVSGLLLRNQDLSYGLYLYHGIVLNLLVHHRVMSIFGLGVMLVCSVAAAALSWRFIEQPALARKTLRRAPVRLPLREPPGGAG